MSRSIFARTRRVAFCASAFALLASTSVAFAQAWGLPEMSPETKACVECHKLENTPIYQQWGNSKHFRANVGCYECHAAKEGEVDAFKHEGQWIATIVSPKDCARCHATEAEEFSHSHHSKAARILGSLDNVLAEVVEGNRGMITPAFQNGNSAAAVSGCWQCHGSEIKVLPGGKLDPATWPNTGIGRINPDGSEGSCSACHSRHSFSAWQARHPDNCGKCHMGPDHPQMEIYYESKHGIAFRAFKDKLNMDSSKWVVGEDYHLAPTCATCHMSATPSRPATKNRPARPGLPVSHDVGLRISWNNRPAISIRPEVSDKKMGFPGADINWETRRSNMKTVCINCHEQQWVDNFYVQYDSLIELYHAKFARTGLELYNLAKPLLTEPQFSNKLDFTWFEIWHHEGRRARHGVSMMGPDYTHWHGTYEVAKHFYSEMVPELRELIHQGKASGDEEKVKAAEALEARLAEVLNSANHSWYLNKMDPEEQKARQQRQEEFKKRYGE
ncbi:MAG: hydroxylamine oxidoreductase [Phycisphaerae bacterium]|nr:hydroxylamine oxidoreductase [Phycisphaerae bacterium]